MFDDFATVIKTFSDILRQWNFKNVSEYMTAMQNF